MGINCHLSVYIKLIMTSVSPVMSLDSLVAPAEEIVIFEKFGDMKLPEDEETEDVDYSPSEAESDDSLEWASETERTMAEDEFYEPCAIVSIINSVLSMLGFELAPALEDSSKPHLEPGTEPYMSEQEFGEMNLSDYDSDEDADYAPSDSEESSDDDLEYDSGASVSSASEAVESAEATELEE